MPTNLPRRKPNAKNDGAFLNVSKNGITTGTLIVSAVLIVLATALPLPLMLPAFGIMAFIAGFAVGLWDQIVSASADVRSARRDAAGLLVLIGSGAILMADMPGAIGALSSLEQSFVN